MSSFIEKFQFNPMHRGSLGVEEEFWTLRKGQLVAVAQEIFLSYPQGSLKPELPIHQIESNTSICKNAQEVEVQLNENRRELARLGAIYDFYVSTDAMPPSEFEVEVYPTTRYREIYKKHGESLRAGWITGLHVHVGCATIAEAIDVHNYLREFLCDIFHYSLRGIPTQRLEQYKLMCDQFVSPYIKDVEMYEQLARENDFYEDPRKCWWVVRINPLGTVEVRIANMQPTAEQSAMIAHLIQAKAHDVMYGRKMPVYKHHENVIKEQLLRIARFPYVSMH